MSQLSKFNHVIAILAFLLLASCGDPIQSKSPESQAANTSQSEEDNSPALAPNPSIPETEESVSEDEPAEPDNTNDSGMDSDNGSQNPPEEPNVPEKREEEMAPGGNNEPPPNNSPDCSTPERSVACEVIDRINQERSQRGLSELTESQACRNLAETHSLDMAMDNFFSHTSPTYGSFSKRAQLFGISGARAENIFMASRPSASLAVQTWMNSTGHRNNILNSRYSKTGVGVSFGNNRYYFTQCFSD